MSSPHYTADELAQLGFARVGRSVMVSRRASFHGIGRIVLGDHVRIDDFCIVSAGVGGVEFGCNIHLGAYSAIIGGGRVVLEDFANISSRVTIYSSNDDYSGATLTGPMVPAEFTNIRREPVRIGRHVIIGSGSVLLPGIDVGDGVAIGALSLVKGDCEAFGVYAGTPARRVGDRQRKLLDLEARFLASRGDKPA